MAANEPRSFHAAFEVQASVTPEAEAVEAEEKDLSPEEQQKRMRREIERTIASDPAAMAKMLETWLLEQKA